MNHNKFFKSSILFLSIIGTVLLTQPSFSEEWQSLFDGKSLQGWIVKCQPKDQDTTFWRIEDGTLVANSLEHKGHDYIWLISEKEYQDFELKLEFQAYRKSPGNSGVQIRSRYDDQASWLDGPQIDINPPGPWRTGMMWDETRGNKRWIYPNLPKGEWVNESMAPDGLKFYYSNDEPAWNHLRIKVKGLKVEAILNGVQITDFQGEGILNDETHRKHNVGQTGHIALQIHKGDQLKIRFREILIREK